MREMMSVEEICHIHTHTSTHTHRDPHTHAHTHTRARARARTHTHRDPTHTVSPSLSLKGTREPGTGVTDHGGPWKEAGFFPSAFLATAHLRAKKKASG